VHRILAAAGLPVAPGYVRVSLAIALGADPIDVCPLVFYPRMKTSALRGPKPPQGR
jgi:hypothetical protein